MAISDKRTRISLTIEKEDRKILEELAEKDERSLTYVINKAIKEYIKTKVKKG